MRTAVLQERGLDPTGQHPKILTSDEGLAADVIVTMGCGDICPVYTGKRYIDWDLPDPAGQTVETVRPIIDDIDRRVRALLDELTHPHAPVMELCRPIMPNFPQNRSPGGESN